MLPRRALHLRPWRALGSPAAALQSDSSHLCSSSGRLAEASVSSHRRFASSYRPPQVVASSDSALVVAKNLLIDTLGLMKNFERQGLSRAQSEALTEHMTEILCRNKERLSEQFVAKSSLEKTILEQEAKIQYFKQDLQKSQDVHLATVLKDVERQQNVLDKIKAEVRHEIDKLSASQRLDLNLEKGRMRDELQQLRDKTTELEIKLDRDVNELKATVERSKNDVIKSVIAIMGTFSAIAFTISRLLGS